MKKKQAHKRIRRERVRCKVCGKITAGRIPKGGDGTLYYPRKHNPPYWQRGLVWSPNKPCPGMLDEAELVWED